MRALINLKNGNRKTGKRERGFTLVEVMVSLGILAFGILAVASMQSAALLGTSQSNAVSQATTVAMDRMERLLALPFTTWDPLPSPPNGDDDSAIFPEAPPDPPINVTSVTWSVQEGQAPVQTTSRLITVTVGYRELRNPIVLTCVKTKVEGE
jgi:prepilin-type N-terminal cleavage/methylation domain-containing protein